MGLIGGSIGLAARRRLEGATVVGWDPDPAALERALERGAIDEGSGSLAEAVDGAEVCFVCAPVGQVAGTARAALERGGDCVVTDVGSVKLAVLEDLAGAGLPDADLERFVGGHPLAGAEASGVEHARPELFEGATWYLTPTDRTSGLLYERLYRTVGSLGARPSAIGAGAHDRLMATVSHLPHVLANVLVGQAARELVEESEGLPATGPSFRDATRVAGANPALWRDIFVSNRAAIVRELDAYAEALDAAREHLRAGNPGELERWIEEARADRQRLLEGQLAGGPVSELRVPVPNRPGIVAQIALALSEAGINIADMALYPAPDMRSGAIALWVAGEGSAERAAELIAELGYAASPVDSGEK
ncbi:MAG: prephenate dehydrogenase/arogenate dehydrogenase family protein [Solirubrobacterales bacterium]